MEEDAVGLEAAARGNTGEAVTQKVGISSAVPRFAAGRAMPRAPEQGWAGREDMGGVHFLGTHFQVPALRDRQAGEAQGGRASQGSPG